MHLDGVRVDLDGLEAGEGSTPHHRGHRKASRSSRLADAVPPIIMVAPSSWHYWRRHHGGPRTFFRVLSCSGVFVGLCGSLWNPLW